MKVRDSFFSVGVMLLMVFSINTYAASFSCARLKTNVEQRICASQELSVLDERLGDLYKDVIQVSPDEKSVRAKQREWIKERNLCADDSCLVRLYKSRTKELGKYTEISFSPDEWSKERKRRIKTVLEGKKLRIPDGFPSDTEFCHQLMDDLKELKGIEVVAPVLITNSKHAPAIGEYVNQVCGGDFQYNISPQRLEQPRKIILYKVDIDNNPDNGKEWVFGDHYVMKIYPEWGEELLVKNEYEIIGCNRGGGYAKVGSSHRYNPKTKTQGIALDTGIHGVMHYRGKYYIYDLIDAPKVDPFRLYMEGTGINRPVCRIK